MNTLITKLTSAISGAVLFAAGCVMAGLGFALVAMLAVFGFVALGVALLATPFLGWSQPHPSDPASTADTPESTPENGVAA
jgi:hypothetical protein